MGRPYIARLITQGKHTEADQLYLRAIDIQEKHQGSGGLSLALNLANRARLKTAQVRWDVSEDFSCYACEGHAAVSARTYLSRGILLLDFCDFRVQQGAVAGFVRGRGFSTFSLHATARRKREWAKTLAAIVLSDGT